MKPQNQESNHVINRPLNGVDSVVRSTPNNNPCSSGGSQSVGADWGRKSDSIDGLMIVMNVVTAIVVVRTLNENVWVGGSNLVTVEILHARLKESVAKCPQMLRSQQMRVPPSFLNVRHRPIRNM